MATNNNPRLEIEITAISTGLTRALQKAKDDLNRFNTEVSTVDVTVTGNGEPTFTTIPVTT